MKKEALSVLASVTQLIGFMPVAVLAFAGTIAGLTPGQILVAVVTFYVASFIDIVLRRKSLMVSLKQIDDFCDQHGIGGLT